MFELGSITVRHELAHLKSTATGQAPVVVMRPADFALWSDWRRHEGPREQRLRARQLALYAAAEVTEQDVYKAHLQMTAASDLSLERADARGALLARAAAGEEVAAEIAELDAEEAASQTQWREAIELMAKLEGAVPKVPPLNETLETCRHTFDLVLACVVRIENVSAHGQPLVWTDAALSAAGLTREGVLLQLLGGDGAPDRLYAMAHKVTQGLTDQEKKA